MDISELTPSFTVGRYAVEFFVQANNVRLVSSLEINTSQGVQSMEKTVNAGSFKGYVAIYAKGHEGSRLSAKVGDDWVIVPVIPAAPNNLYRHVDFTGVGVECAVRIYIDRVLMDTIYLTTK
ncbi:MAG: hypothetical protein K9G13_06530 [Aquiluna sp.]|nr:hypothetical protein [Aquiluna sp.]MCF8546172.1 hypothetical protein [Aquiluna sp.]